ncbi:MAG: NAD(P)/FAD-dependent oxidoreductase [Pseudohongiella sp.]|nr:NAD(P)/FAD-dependent oxidoreductase [Pseudohongiella sp.]
MRIAVLGAGPMGLAAAYQLVRDGHQVVLFEADDRLGGMTASFDFNGLLIERYYHFHCLSDHGLLQMLDELGIADRMRWKETHMGFWHQKQLQDWGNPVALLRFKGLGFVSKVRYGLHAFCATKRSSWHDLDNVSASEWIKRWVGKSAWETLWKPLFEFKFYHYADNLSAAWIWSRIHRVGGSRYNLMREKLGYLEGGSETLLQAMASAIRQGGGEIRLSCPVQQVRSNQGRVTGLQIKDSPICETFDKVVSTVPLPFVPQLIPDLPPAALARYRALDNIAAVCVIVKLRSPLTDKFWLNINDPDMDIPGLVEYSNLRPLEHAVVYVPFYLPADHPSYADTDEVFEGKVRRYLKTIKPALVDDDFLDLRVSRYRYAQPICPPGFSSALPPYQTEIDGLWVADTSYYYPNDRGISESLDFGRKLAKEAVA